MKVKVIFYILTDALGHKSWDCVKDYSDSICIGGTGKDGAYHQYDSYEGYHGYAWATERGMTLECIEKEIEI